MEDLCRKAVDVATVAGATYADIRIVEIKRERIVVRNGKVRHLDVAESGGFGVRAIANGAWGFSSSNVVTPEEIRDVATTAVKIAKASSRVKREDVVLAPAKAAEQKYSTLYKRDPFEVPMEEKIRLLMECDKRMRAQGDLIKVSLASMNAYAEKKVFASSEGSKIEQEILWCGGGISATAVGKGEVQTRSYPASFRGDFSTAGYEFIEGLNLEEGALSCGKEALNLLDAKNCPSKVTDVIIGGSQLSLQIHESCGHPSELDRVFGTEASYAGTSFLTQEKVGKFRYGNDFVTIVADATAPGGLGTFAYDDEGVPAQKVDIVRDGTFKGYLTDRQWAAKMGLPSSTGAARASSWNRIPIVRMTNINLEPGDWTFEELVTDTKEGIYVEMNRSWSIDDKRLNFQFGTEIGREIRNGEVGSLLKNATYTGITYQFWRSCDAICSRQHWHLWGIPTCGKGEPSQTMYVGHGCSPSRFKNIRVGVGRPQR